MRIQIIDKINSARDGIYTITPHIDMNNLNGNYSVSFNRNAYKNVLKRKNAVRRMIKISTFRIL